MSSWTAPCYWGRYVEYESFFLGLCDLIHSDRRSTILPNWQMRVTKFLTWKGKVILIFIFTNGTGTSSSSCMRFSRYVGHSLSPCFSILTSLFIAKEPASAKQTFSSSKEPSAFRTIPVLEYLKETWGNMANHPKFSEVKNSIHKGIENLDKWYNKVNDTDAYFICLRMCLRNFIPITRDLLTLWFTVLDPNVKNAYALDKWDAESYAAGMVQLEKVVCSCFSAVPDEELNAFLSSLILTMLHLPKKSWLPSHHHVRGIAVDLCIFSESDFPARNAASGQYGYSWMRASVRSRQEAERVSSGPRDELKRYLDSPLEEVNDVVAWWGVSSFIFHW